MNSIDILCLGNSLYLGLWLLHVVWRVVWHGIVLQYGIAAWYAFVMWHDFAMWYCNETLDCGVVIMV